MEITNGEVKAEVPDTLAKLLINNRGWKKDRTGGKTETVTLADRVKALVEDADDDDPIPLTHIPGVVPGISMNRLKKLVGDGTIPFTLDGRTKLVRPSAVSAALKDGA
jgi:hypothetical protein